MFYCDKATSVLFPQIDKIIQVYTCRISSIFPCPFRSGKHSRKTQRSITYKNDRVGSTEASFQSVHTYTDDEVSTDKDLDEACPNYCAEYNKTSQPTAVMYGIEDTTQYGETPIKIRKNVINKGKTNEYGVRLSKKINRRKRRSQVSRKDTGVQSKKDKKVSKKSQKEAATMQMPSKLVNTKQSTFDKKSLISLYRKRKIGKSNQCGLENCPFEINEKNKHGKKRKSVREKIKIEMKPKYEQEQNKQPGEELAFAGKLIDKPCVKGLCAKAKKLNDKDFVCSCENKKKPETPVPAVRCTNKTCKKEYNLALKSSVTKLKDKMSEVFRKYSKKIKVKNGRNVQIDPNKICEEGVCKDAYNQENQDICCKCKLKVKKCTDTTCSNNTSESRTVCQRLQYCFKSLKHSPKKHTLENVVVQNEKEQTGDPLFEIKVNAMDMCVLNSSEIEDKVKSLGQVRKRDKCICPSHEARKQYILEREACLDGVCRKALKDKKTDFTCNCLKNKVWTCDDSTCNKAVTFQNDGVNSVKNKIDTDKPLFEVQVDSRNKCIINSNEMRYKLDDVKRKSEKLCRYGICKEKSKDRNTRIVCNCKKPMASDECAEETCRAGNNTCNYIQKCCRCGKPRSKKMIRGNLDTNSLKNITSQFSGFCARMFSRSDNWTNHQNKKRQRQCRRCNNGMLRPQSVKGTRRRAGLKIMIKQQTQMDNNEAVTNCCTCDNDFNGKVKENVGDTVDNNKNAKAQKVVKSKRIKEPVEQNQGTDKKKKAQMVVKSKRTKEPVKQNQNTEKKKKSPDIANSHPQSKSFVKRKVHQRSGVVVPIPSSKLAKTSSKIVKKKIEAICKCHHICKCSEEEHKRKMKERNRKKMGRARSYKKKKQKKKKVSVSEDKRHMQESLEKRKQFSKERKKVLKEEDKRRKKRKKEEMEVMRFLESKEGASRHTNCFVELFAQILSVGLAVVKLVLFTVFKIISNPKGSYWYARERMIDPQATLILIKRAIRHGWRIRKLKVTKCMKNSETVSILSDTFKDSTLYQTFVDKGKTKKEQQAFEIETKRRKRRVRKRNEAALYSCRHVLLNTLRKTPCLWVYHICPEFYPQCLSCVGFLRNFWHMIVFMCALACWTPCILCCELTRALCCCFLCTG